MSPKIPLLVISGLTATGKTSLAVTLAKKFNGQLISADSRQIYRGLDIGTGKDHPSDMSIALINIKNPDQNFSVSDFHRLASKHIKKIHHSGHLPIVVGGSGYYIKSLFSPQFIPVPPHLLFRRIGNHLPLFILQFANFLLNHRQYKGLNNSEKYNRHRLIRKLEIRIFLRSLSPQISFPDYNSLHLCLVAPPSSLFKRIDQRIKQRLAAGLLKEIKNLLKKYRWSDPGLNTLAYKEFSPYFAKPTVKNKKQALKLWRQDEHAYARRQLTWFKKQKSLHYLNINSPFFPGSAINLVSKWYNKL